MAEINMLTMAPTIARAINVPYQPPPSFNAGPKIRPIIKVMRRAGPHVIEVQNTKIGMIRLTAIKAVPKAAPLINPKNVLLCASIGMVPCV